MSSCTTTMLDFAILTVTFLVALIIARIWRNMNSKSSNTTIPGLAPATKEDGNQNDIGRLGGLHKFLMYLHETYGPIATFWMGSMQVVSIASPELFKQHQALFDHPPKLFPVFEQLLGPNVIQLANGTEARARRQAYDKSFSHDNLSYYYKHFQELTDDLCKQWSTLVGKDNHVPLNSSMFSLTLKASLIALMGDHFRDDQEILTFKNNYDLCFAELELRFAEPMVPGPTTPRGKTFAEARGMLDSQVKKVIDARRQHRKKAADYLLIDAILDYSDNLDTIFSDTLSYFIGGFHTTGNLLTWALYFVATHQDVQTKVYKELRKVLGNEDNVNPGNLSHIRYLRQVLDETLRCAVVAPMTNRIQNCESELGGHRIPKGTPVIHALGVVLQDKHLWPQPDSFNPERFSPENIKNIPRLAFSPFGFAGKRLCPGQRFSYIEATVVLSTLLRKFTVDLVEGQAVEPVYGIVTHPKDEIWVTLNRHKDSDAE